VQSLSLKIAIDGNRLVRGGGGGGERRWGKWRKPNQTDSSVVLACHYTCTSLQELLLLSFLFYYQLLLFFSHLTLIIYATASECKHVLRTESAWWLEVQDRDDRNAAVLAP